MIASLCGNQVMKKKRGRKCTKIDKTQMLLNNLPRGFTFKGPSEHRTKEHIMNEIMLQGNKNQNKQLDPTSDIQTIGSFTINLAEARISDFKLMRKLLPRS